MNCTAIGWYDVFINVVVPLLSALIGGLITMLGVVYTIKHEQKNSQEQERLAVKPWIISVDDDGTNDMSDSNFYLMEADCALSHETNLVFLIKNTDNGVAILERFQTKNNTYLPTVGRILDKKRITCLEIRIAPKETLEDMYLCIKDIYGNPYYYQAEGSDISKKTYMLTEVKGIPEFRH